MKIHEIYNDHTIAEKIFTNGINAISYKLIFIR